MNQRQQNDLIPDFEDFLKLLELGYKDWTNRQYKIDSPISARFAKAMIAELDDFKNNYHPSEILSYYEFSTASQELFYNELQKSASKLVTIHLGLTFDSTGIYKDLLETKPHVQYIFEFENSSDYYILLNSNNVIKIEKSDLDKLVANYQHSRLYKDLSTYLETKTGQILTENTKKIFITDITARTNQIYNEIEKKLPTYSLSTMYVVPSIQLLDFFSMDEKFSAIYLGTLQLFSFGVIMSTEQNLMSSTAIIDDRHYHCPPNLCS